MLQRRLSLTCSLTFFMSPRHKWKCCQPIFTVIYVPQNLAVVNESALSKRILSTSPILILLDHSFLGDKKKFSETITLDSCSIELFGKTLLQNLFTFFGASAMWHLVRVPETALNLILDSDCYLIVKSLSYLCRFVDLLGSLHYTQCVLASVRLWLLPKL